jgi:hypothetical protein
MHSTRSGCATYQFRLYAVYDCKNQEIAETVVKSLVLMSILRGAALCS